MGQLGNLEGDVLKLDQAGLGYSVFGGANTGDTYYTALYANPGHDNHWVKLKVEGVESNRFALGAGVRIIVATTAGERSIHRTVSTGGSLGAAPLLLHIGLGDAESIKAIHIFWPTTGKTQCISGVPMERTYKIREGDTAAAPWEMRSFQFRNADDWGCGTASDTFSCSSQVIPIACRPARPPSHRGRAKRAPQNGVGWCHRRSKGFRVTARGGRASSRA